MENVNFLHRGEISIYYRFFRDRTFLFVADGVGIYFCILSSVFCASFSVGKKINKMPLSFPHLLFFCNYFAGVIYAEYFRVRMFDIWNIDSVTVPEILERMWQSQMVESALEPAFLVIGSKSILR